MRTTWRRRRRRRSILLHARRWRWPGRTSRAVSLLAASARRRRARSVRCRAVSVAILHAVVHAVWHQPWYAVAWHHARHHARPKRCAGGRYHAARARLRNVAPARARAGWRRALRHDIKSGAQCRVRLVHRLGKTWRTRLDTCEMREAAANDEWAKCLKSIVEVIHERSFLAQALVRRAFVVAAVAPKVGQISHIVAPPLLRTAAAACGCTAAGTATTALQYLPICVGVLFRLALVSRLAPEAVKAWQQRLHATGCVLEHATAIWRENHQTNFHAELRAQLHRAPTQRSALLEVAWRRKECSWRPWRSRYSTATTCDTPSYSCTSSCTSRLRLGRWRRRRRPRGAALANGHVPVAVRAASFLRLL